MSILIGADFVPTKNNIELFNAGDAVGLVGNELLRVLKDADFRIFNLEVPLTDISSPIEKCGPNLIAPTSTINGYKSIGVNFVTLANNHILDQGSQGIISTCETLKNNGISYCGVGTLADASKPFIFAFGNKRVGVYVCAEHEFSIATENSIGANPYDPLESFDHVLNLKKNVDYLIVLYHGGKEHYRYPSPNLQRVCRKFIKSGANLIICQHTHCIGCEEKYLDGTIVYGQGNFLFDYYDSEFWQTSLLLSIDKNFDISYIPIVKTNCSVRLAESGEKRKILRGFFARSEEIKKEGFIEKHFAEFATTKIDDYLLTLSGVKSDLVFKVLNKLTSRKFGKILLKKKYKTKTLLAIENFICCESHKELLLKGITERELKK